MLVDRGHSLDHDRLDADGQQPGVRHDQRGAVAIADFPPEWLISAQVGVNLLQPTVFDHLRDRHLGSGTCKPFGQRHGDVFGALGPGDEDDGLSFGEFRHGAFPYWSWVARKAFRALSFVAVARRVVMACRPSVSCIVSVSSQSL